MKIAVTGASGHVGYNLCNALLARGHQIRALSHRNTRGIADLPLDIIHGDVLKRDSINELMSGVDFCYHLAASISIRGDKSGDVWRINVEGTRNVVEAAMQAGVQRLIHFSSIHAFVQTPVDKPLDEERPLVKERGFAYDRSKAEGERIVKHAASQGLNAIILSPTAIIGPADTEPSLTGKALLELYYHQIPALIPGGYDWVDVRDVAQAAINAMTMGRPGEKYLLAGHWHSLKDLSKLVSEVTGKKTPGLIIPLWLAKLGLPFITVYSKISGAEPLYTSESLQIITEGNRNISNNKAAKELDFHPRDLRSTLQDSFSWFSDKGLLND